MLTSEERREVLMSPAVRDVSDTRIHYTPEFRCHLLACLDRGVSPTRVFEEAGLPSSLIGCKRIERAAAHARRSRKTRERLERYGDVWEDGLIGGRCPVGGDAVMIALSQRVNSLERQVRSLERDLMLAHATGRPDGNGGA